MIRFKSTSSKRWLERQVNDQFTKKSKAMNYKSRAAFKLVEINDKYKILNGRCHNILDLGFAPGSWSQVMHNELPQANILGVDLLRCSPPKGVSFLQGDFLDPATKEGITAHFSNEKLDLVVSDMMTNTTGIKDVDHLASMDLCQSVVDLAEAMLSKNGSVVMKFFMGREQALLEQRLRTLFSKVYTFKPQSSRNELREQFLVGVKRR